MEFGEFHDLEPVCGDGDSNFEEKIMVEIGNVFRFEAILDEKKTVFVGVKRVEAGS